MSSGIVEFFSAWREIVHISEWTGLSLGALACVAALLYFEHIPLGTAVRAVVLVIAVFVSLCVGETFGAKDKQRQWDSARTSAEKAQSARDKDIELALDQKYKPQLEQLTKQAQANKDLADGYEKKMVGLLAKGPTAASPAGGACQLGSLAGRLHLRR